MTTCEWAHGMQAIDALREVFTVALLPDRKLVSFEDQPLSAVPSGKEGLRRLLYFHFEDQLKKRYAATMPSIALFYGRASSIECLLSPVLQLASCVTKQPVRRAPQSAALFVHYAWSCWGIAPCSISCGHVMLSS